MDKIENHHGHTLKIIEMGLQNRVFQEMKKPRFSAASLAIQLKNEGTYVSAHSIRKFIKKSKKAQAELISRDLREADEYKKLTINYGKALKEILTEVEEVKNTAKKDKDYTTYNQLVGRLMQGLELIAKLTGDIKPKGSIDIKIIYNEINIDVEKRMKLLKNEIFKGKEIDIDAEIIEEDKIASENIN